MPSTSLAESSTPPTSGSRQYPSGGSFSTSSSQSLSLPLRSSEPPPSLRLPRIGAGSVSSTSHENVGPGSCSCTPKPPGDARNDSSKIEWFDAELGDGPHPTAPLAPVSFADTSAPFRSTSTSPLPNTFSVHCSAPPPVHAQNRL